MCRRGFQAAGEWPGPYTYLFTDFIPLLRSFVDLESLDGIVLCSSVPPLVREYEAFTERWTGAELLVLGPGVSTGVQCCASLERNNVVEMPGCWLPTGATSLSARSRKPPS